VNSHYTRIILSSYGTVALGITYWTCPSCKKHFHDHIIGVPGSANYSYEFYEKQMSVRYNGRCSLNNSRRIGETYTEGLTDLCGRAPCATSLWLYEQKQAELSKQELLSQKIGFDGTLYIDGKWVKKCGKKKLEVLFGKELSKKEWNKIRYKSIYVVATKEKVILNFEITKNLPKSEDLLPLITRIKNRFPESTIQKIVSDEDTAITKAIKAVFPKVIHGFCIFHQLKNVTKRYCDEFKSIENIPDDEKIVYYEICQLIRSYTVIDSVIHYRNIVNLQNHMKLSEASSNAMSYAKEIFHKNKDLLKEGFTPETDNTMEQIVSLVPLQKIWLFHKIIKNHHNSESYSFSFEQK
jgi:hypothetical protein